jgi:hypothetical protein
MMSKSTEHVVGFGIGRPPLVDAVRIARYSDHGFSGDSTPCVPSLTVGEAGGRHETKVTGFAQRSSYKATGKVGLAVR